MIADSGQNSPDFEEVWSCYSVVSGLFPPYVARPERLTLLDALHHKFKSISTANIQFLQARRHTWLEVSYEESQQKSYP